MEKVQRHIYNQKYDAGILEQFNQVWLKRNELDEIVIQMSYEPIENVFWVDLCDNNSVLKVLPSAILGSVVRRSFEIVDDVLFETIRVIRFDFPDELDFHIQGDPILKASLEDIRNAVNIFQLELKI
jgi:hypothetical protein